MPPNNPYIELVKAHEKIFTLESEIYWKQWKWSDFFESQNDLVLEIWIGLGNFFSKQVRWNSDKNYIWMEIRYKRLFQTAEKCFGRKSNYAQNNSPSFLDRPHPNPGSAPAPARVLPKGEGEKGINNFILLKEFWEKIWDIFWEEELSETYIFFPDPWANKKSQLKNRLLQTEFLENLYNVTKVWGKLVIKTDHRWYFDFLLEELEKTDWKQTYISFDFESEPEFQNAETTEFQQLFRGQNEKIHHIELER